MRDFLKNVFANIVAILVIMMVVFGFFMLMIFASAMSEDQKPTVKENSVLVLNFKTPVLDSYTEEETSLFDFGEKKSLILIDILNAINKAKTAIKKRIFSFFHAYISVLPCCFKGFSITHGINA